ncbi:hypothetical protein IFM89_024117 [Coptis chinensis]|uniref:HECT-type E3 ubiquitin transferase n=1 Tax=Coptis chinensis TaxID=261450 RepID=A0A835I6R1_9MAGN|nr:hypothetical protein IFM89_024117 [Coptis chinensis]
MSFREDNNRIISSSSSKRKLDDYGPIEEEEEEDTLSDLIIPVKMKKDESNSVNSSSFNNNNRISSRTRSKTRVSSNHASSSTSSSSIYPDDGSMMSTTKCLHFFVRIMMSGKNTIVVHANSDDSVESVHEQIRNMTGIPIFEQRLIYEGRQLQWEQTLEQCGVENDAGLQLVGRMRSTDYPQTWQVVIDLVSSICSLCRGGGGLQSDIRNVKFKVKEFLRLTPKEESERASGHLKIFKAAGAPTALFMLYLSPYSGNKECAEESIRLLLTPNLDFLPKTIQVHCASIVLEFCKLLYGNPQNESLYVACRSTLGSLLDTIKCAHGSKSFDNAKPAVIIQEFLPFVRDLAGKLTVGFESSWNSSPCTEAALAVDVRDFNAFLNPLLKAIEDHVGGVSILPIHLHNKHPSYMAEIEQLYDIFCKLLETISQCLARVEDMLVSKGAEVAGESNRFSWYQYIPVLKELKSVCKLYKGAEEILDSVMKLRRFPLNALIKYLKRSDDHYWLLEHKDLTDFEARRHLVMMMFPDLVEEYEELHEMLIDRSQLLEESFEYIGRADPESFHGGLFMEFKNEEATGPGVLREWFYLVCQAIFNPQNPLFLACPNDHRRFFPNPEGCVCGEEVALRLKAKRSSISAVVALIEKGTENLWSMGNQDAEIIFLIVSSHLLFGYSLKENKQGRHIKLDIIVVGGNTMCICIPCQGLARICRVVKDFIAGGDQDVALDPGLVERWEVGSSELVFGGEEEYLDSGKIWGANVETSKRKILRTLDEREARNVEKNQKGGWMDEGYLIGVNMAKSKVVGLVNTSDNDTMVGAIRSYCHFVYQSGVFWVVPRSVRFPGFQLSRVHSLEGRRLGDHIDQRIHFPTTSKVDSLHLDYFRFCGRMIALSLMHKVQVGIVFDRVFFLQLAEKAVSLEDVRDADPCLYMSLKKILEMDAEFLDSDALGLTFVREIEELGSRKVVELCPGGKGIIVNSQNREDYVNLLVQHRFVTSISEQVSRFAQGFRDILSNSIHQKLFFQSLELEDLDRMLHGSDTAICVKDWKAHTDYHGYRETDRQICWFWKVVEGMSTDQQRVLLFFWTSVKYLPVGGFGGLASRLHIYKASDSHDRLPSSHTCFYRLCLPPYTSKASMRNCLQVITQEHVSCSFGTW